MSKSSTHQQCFLWVFLLGHSNYHSGLVGMDSAACSIVGLWKAKNVSCNKFFSLYYMMYKSYIHGIGNKIATLFQCAEFFKGGGGLIVQTPPMKLHFLLPYLTFLDIPQVN